MKIFLDMDGVIVDWVSDVLIAMDSSLGHDDVVQWDLATVLGVTQDVLWAKLNKVENFWLGLKPYRGLELFYEGLKATGAEIYILSSPVLDNDCATHKMQWIHNHLPELDGRVILCRQKHLLAGFDRILIDDSDQQIADWNTVGGRGILMPRPWNADRGLTHEQAQLRVLKALT